MFEHRKFETSIEGITHGRAALALMMMITMRRERGGKAALTMRLKGLAGKADCVILDSYPGQGELTIFPASTSVQVTALTHLHVWVKGIPAWHWTGFVLLIIIYE